MGSVAKEQHGPVNQGRSRSRKFTCIAVVISAVTLSLHIAGYVEMYKLYGELKEAQKNLTIITTRQAALESRLKRCEDRIKAQDDYIDFKISHQGRDTSYYEVEPPQPKLLKYVERMIDKKS